MITKSAIALFLIGNIIALPAQAQNQTQNPVDPYIGRTPSVTAPQSTAPSPTIPTPETPASSDPTVPIIIPPQPKSLAEMAVDAETKSAGIIRLCRVSRDDLASARARASDLSRQRTTLDRRLGTWQKQAASVTILDPSIAESHRRLEIALKSLKEATALAEGGAGGACGAWEMAKVDKRTSIQRQAMTDAREGNTQAQRANDTHLLALKQCQAAAQELRHGASKLPSRLATQASLATDITTLRQTLHKYEAKHQSLTETASSVASLRTELLRIKDVADEFRAKGVVSDDPTAYTRIRAAIAVTSDCTTQLETGIQVLASDNIVSTTEATLRQAEEIVALPESRAFETALRVGETAKTAGRSCQAEADKISTAVPRAASCLANLENLSGATLAHQATELESARQRCPPGSRPQWNDEKNIAECGCPISQGMVWNADSTACNSRAAFDEWASARCRAELAGSIVASGDPVTGQYSCHCPAGLVRATDGKSCLKVVELRAYCNRALWGSEPLEAYTDGRVQCGCPRGSESYRGECVRADIYESPFRRSYPYGDLFGRDRCYRDRFTGRIYCDRL
ncbi:MAG: hypothetical protein R3E60_05365 [Alphaproteobacteria bacterium]